MNENSQWKKCLQLQYKFKTEMIKTAVFWIWNFEVTKLALKKQNKKQLSTIKIS